jgi:autotransporter-associated beta strand protein
LAFGSGIFIQGNQTITFAPQSGQTLTINGVIADQTGSTHQTGFSAAGDPLAGAGGLLIDGLGDVVLNAANTYTGGTTIHAGTLEIGVNGTPSGGGIAFTSPTGTMRVDGTSAPANTISGFVSGDTIDLAGIGWQAGDTPDYTVATGILRILNSGSTVAQLNFGAGNAIVDDPFHVNEETGGTGIVITNDAPCFCPGTLIRTERGEVPVEGLDGGHRVVTASGGLRPIRWVGHRRLDLTRHPAPNRARPIRIRANAFADGSPARDLLLSPDHAVACDGVLIPIRLLLNSVSITRETKCDVVTYHHVELDSHDILLAENLPAESYLDTGNRFMFENSIGPTTLHPDLTNDQSRREAESCLPFADDATRVEPVWRALVARAAHLCWHRQAESATTEDPLLRLWINGRSVAPVSVATGRHVFLLPGADIPVRIQSRAAVPSESRPWILDDRRLGVMLRGLTVRAGAEVLPIPLDHPAFGAGWWEPERRGLALCRWTNGDAVVPMAVARMATAGPCLLEIDVAAMLSYPLAVAPEVHGERLSA